MKIYLPNYIYGQTARTLVDDAAAFASRASGATVRADLARRFSPRAPNYYGTGLEVFLYGDGTVSRVRSGHRRVEYAATYDQWGDFVNFVLSLHPRAKCGPYVGREKFDEMTNNAFRAIKVADSERSTAR